MRNIDVLVGTAMNGMSGKTNAAHGAETVRCNFLSRSQPLSSRRRVLTFQAFAWKAMCPRSLEHLQHFANAAQNYTRICAYRQYICVTCIYFLFPQRYAVPVELHVSSSFPSAEWRNKMKKEKKRKEQENLWLQDKLLTSTYNTGPDGFV